MWQIVVTTYKVIRIISHESINRSALAVIFAYLKLYFDGIRLGLRLDSYLFGYSLIEARKDISTRKGDHIVQHFSKWTWHLQQL